MMYSRTKLIADTCPRCGAHLEVDERGTESGTGPGVGRWIEDDRRCSDGCLLTADDFD